MATTEQWARYETAKEIFLMMMASLSCKIYREGAKACPDVVQIAQWKARRTEFSHREDDLAMDDTDGIEQVIAVYGPKVRADYEKRVGGL